MAARFRETTGQERNLSDLGAGVARWAAIALRAAIWEQSLSGDALKLWLVDEPEAHLHLGAVRDIRDWFRQRSEEGIGIVIATHALELLDVQAERADILLLNRNERGASRTVRATNLLDSLEAYAGDLGISGGDALRLARAVLIVEGKHDQQVIRYFYGEELANHRIIVLRLHGVKETLALVELEYLAKLGLPLTYLCDNVRPEFLEEPRRLPRLRKSRRSLNFGWSLAETQQMRHCAEVTLPPGHLLRIARNGRYGRRQPPTSATGRSSPITTGIRPAWRKPLVCHASTAGSSSKCSSAVESGERPAEPLEEAMTQLFA